MPKHLGQRQSVPLHWLENSIESYLQACSSTPPSQKCLALSSGARTSSETRSNRDENGKKRQQVLSLSAFRRRIWHPQTTTVRVRACACS
eukprot:6177682-Pleurochrysis_carterae.AAC.5